VEKELNRRKLLRFNLYVKEFHADTEEEELRNLFSQFGEIKSLAVYENKAVAPEDPFKKKFAFVSFKTAKAAEECQQKLNNTPFKEHVLYVGFAETKLQRKAKLEEIFYRKELQSIRSKRFPINPYYMFLAHDMQFGMVPPLFIPPGLPGAPMGRGGRMRPPFMLPPYFVPPFDGQMMMRPQMGPRHMRPPINPAQQQPYTYKNTARNVQMQEYGRPPYPYQGQVHPMHAPYQQRPPRIQHSPMTAPQPPIPQQLPPQVQQNAQPPSQQLSAMHAYAMSVLQSQEFTQATIENQKQFVGEYIYNFIENKSGTEHAGKVTAMLLDLDFDYLKNLIADPLSLEVRIKEAMDMLTRGQDQA